MRRYRYKAKDSEGKVVSGEVEASNEKIAVKLIHDRGLVVIAISPVKIFSLGFLTKFKDRIGVADVSNLTRQLATMVNAGLPITEALLILRSQSKGSLQKVLAQILADVEEGSSLSSSLSKFPDVFSKTYVALIKSGETGGVLDEVLARLSENLEKQQEFQGKVKSAMIYPIIIIFGMIAVSLIMLVFVIPKLTQLYEQFDADLPVTTKFLILVSNFLSTPQLWPVLIAVIIALIYALRLYKNTQKGRRRFDAIMLKIPLIGSLRRQIILADLTRTLSLMVGSGVSILEGLNISSEVVGNEIMAEALRDISQLVEKGFPMAYAFSKHQEDFPFILSQMIAVGEETGKMEEVLGKVSHVFEVESDQRLKALTSAIEPIILIVLGIGVAFIVISIIMPIYNLTTQI